MTFLMAYIQDVVIPATNAHLTSETNMKEFVVWLGCVFFMSCYQGITDQHLWWSLQSISMREGAPFCLGVYKSRNQWEDICNALWYTLRPAPEFVDKIHPVTELQDDFKRLSKNN